MRIPHRTAGVGGPEVSVLSLGSWHTWDRMDFADAVELVRAAVDAGVDLFDVGHYNVGPHVEGSHTDVLLGRIIEAAEIPRSSYLLCQKLWLWRYPEQSLSDQLDRGLFRVGADRTDIAILGDFLGRLDIPRVVTDLAELIADGRVAYWGVNNWAAGDVRAAHAFAVREGMPTPTLAQLKYSVCRRSVPEGAPYRRVFEELGIGLQASDVFEGGILVRGEPPTRRVGADPGGIRDAVTAAAPRLAAIAGDFGATPAQLAIGYCLTHPATTSVLFGASRMEQFTDDLGAVELVSRHGDAIRDAVAELWLDRDAVRPDASWGATREDALNPPGR